MNYRRVQFIKSIVFQRSPYTILAEADSSEYVLTGEGPHVRVTRAGVSCIVPWSNIAAVELMPQEPAPKQHTRRNAVYPAPVKGKP